MNRLPQLAAAVVDIAVLLLVALYVARPHQTEVTSPSVRGPTAARSVYPSIEVDPTWTPAPSPDRTPRILDVASGDLRTLPRSSELSFISVLSDGSLLFASGTRGRAEVIGVDGSLIATLFVPNTNEYRLSVDRRYVAWLTDDDQLQVYDARTKRVDVDAVSLAGVRFSTTLSDGAVVLPRPSGSAIIRANGAVEKIVQAADWQVAVSPDGNSLAWVQSAGLYIYNRRTHAETTYKDVQWVTDTLAWSPDARQVAYRRLTGDNALHVEVLDIASGVQHEVYAGAPYVGLERLHFVAAHRLEFHLNSGDFARFGDIGGARYQVNDDATNGVLLDQPSTQWDTCGPKCGMPPDGYESENGIALWCQLQADNTCLLHNVFVDRARGRMHELTAGYDFFPVAISPDRTRLAYALSSDALRIHILNLDDFTERGFTFDLTFVNNLTWLDGGSLLLTRAGGN